MSTSVKLENIVNSLVRSSPPCELNGVSKNLSTILSEQAGTQLSLNKSVEGFVNENFAVFSSSFIASQHNKKENSTKYIDYINKKLFNIDIASKKAIDFEDFENFEEVEYPDYYNQLVESLKKYGEDHYPSEFAFTVIPEGANIRIITIGQKVNDSNYYTGQWKSHFIVTNSGSISGSISLDIHYFEDGNVRLNSKEDVSRDLQGLNASKIVNTISDFEDETTLKIIENFNQLNKNSFKNLRRLLPVTRSRVNWGKAIGNYRLGSDVVNSK